MLPEDVINKVNKYLNRHNVRTRYSGAHCVYNRIDALNIKRVISSYCNRLSELSDRQRDTTTREIFAELLIQNPTNYSIAAICQEMNALTLDEMHKAAAKGLASIVQQIPSEEYENLLAEAKANQLYSPHINCLLKGPDDILK